MEHHFEIVDKNQIRIAGKNYHLPVHGINSIEFYNFYENLVNNYKFKIKNVDFPFNKVRARAYESKKIETIRPIKELVIFIIYSNILEKNGIKIDNLINQIKHCTDYNIIRHASSLSLLSYIYHREGYKIKIFSTRGADFQINSLKADVKCIRPNVFRNKKIKIRKVKGKNVADIKNEIILGISQAISSRLTEGVRQADLLFFDFSENIFFSSLSIFNKNVDRIIEPKEKRLIIYNNKFVPEGIIYNMIEGKTYGSVEKKFPDVFITNGYNIDFDRELWDFDLY